MKEVPTKILLDLLNSYFCFVFVCLFCFVYLFVLLICSFLLLVNLSIHFIFHLFFFTKFLNKLRLCLCVCVFLTKSLVHLTPLKTIAISTKDGCPNLLANDGYFGQACTLFYFYSCLSCKFKVIKGANKVVVVVMSLELQQKRFDQGPMPALETEVLIKRLLPRNDVKEAEESWDLIYVLFWGDCKIEQLGSSVSHGNIEYFFLFLLHFSFSN